ncbi:MAG: NmrA family transcriptional regulator, partial [Mesorhizobium sp.]
QGVSAVYISYYPDIAVPGAAETVDAFARLAVQNGVTRLVLLSGRGETEAQRAEEMLKASGADWTILRCAWFSQNFSEGFFTESLAEGEVALPIGNVG